MHATPGVPTEGRCTEIDVNLVIEGDFLLFDFIAHEPSFCIRKVNSTMDLITFLCSKKGIFNLFTTVLFPVIKGHLKVSQDYIKLIEAQYAPTRLEWNFIKDIQNNISKEIQRYSFEELSDSLRICVIGYK
ncbi:hypothetical protein GCM10022393_33910 [Aquimarina addita]|uniref:Uncharacterized protein n=1 Tax=Aquimarina addita TaxID=870485 RepID=A0ABP6USW1_9FLAO